VTLTVPAVPTSLDLSRASDREALGPTAEGLSSASFERLTIDGDPYVIKRLSYDTDWVMRAVDDSGPPRVVRMFATGMFARLPACIDTTLVAVAYDPGTGQAELLMRDVGDLFLRDDDPITVQQHATVIDAMSQLHAATWDMTDDIGLTPSASRWSALSPVFSRQEAERGPLTGVPAAIQPLWDRLAEVDPPTHRVLLGLAEDPAPLVAGLARTPHALVHGDFKGGNLGLHPDGRVVLVDWAFPGIDAPCADLAWYLAVNCERIPESKEATIARYRAALESHGIDTGGWWDRQLALSLLGGAVQMAWSKADQPEELAWWAAWVHEASALLR
jgi:hypothetical protein